MLFIMNKDAVCVFSIEFNKESCRADSRVLELDLPSAAENYKPFEGCLLSPDRDGSSDHGTSGDMHPELLILRWYDQTDRVG